jgi:cyclophilin family peptidyl-prolyl cis-trans isomerase
MLPHVTLYSLVLIILMQACARPVAQFTWEGDPPPAPAAIQFENHSLHASSFRWEMGDGQLSDLKSPEHVFALSGSYTVALTARRGKKEDRVEKTIHIPAPEPCLVEVQTPFGQMVIQLYDETPLHRDNFLKLAEEGFYDSLLFHRVIKGFMIQGGDPNSRGAGPDTRLGAGGPGYMVDAEIHPDLVHTKGALCAARMSDGVNPQRKSSGSQFYIVQGNKATDAILDGIESKKGFRYTAEQRKTYKYVGGTPHLDGDYTVFGRVVEGMDVIDHIAAVRTAPGDRPEVDVWMTLRVIR